MGQKGKPETPKKTVIARRGAQSTPKKQNIPTPPHAVKPTRPAQTAPLIPPAETEKRTDQCPRYKRCGGCQLQNMDYPRQLRWKQVQVEQLLQRFHSVEPIIGMQEPYHYRNKVQAAFGYDRDRRMISGIYQSSTKRIVAADNCMIEDQKADELIVSIRKLWKDFKLTAYDEHRETGLLRHVLVKRGFTSGQIMVVLVLASPIFPARKRFTEALHKLHPEITTILMNVNTSQLNLLLGDAEKTLYGSGFIEDTLCGCIFRISAKSFYQINPIQTEILYQKAIELAGLTGQETIIDTYCGIGTIGLIASHHAKNVIGIELNRDAVKDAIANAKRNEITNVHFYNGDAGKFMTELAETGEQIDVVFMDPPRAGSDERFLTALKALAPKRIIYISCNPETLCRDLEILTRNTYRVMTIQPVDMFPHTNHVECVVALHRVEK